MKTWQNALRVGLAALDGSSIVRAALAHVRDLRADVDAAVAAPDAKLDGELAVYGAADAIPDELLDEACRLYVDVRMAVRGADVGKAAAGP